MRKWDRQDWHYGNAPGMPMHFVSVNSGVCRREVLTIGLKVGEMSTAVPRIVLEPQPGSCSYLLPRGDGTARGMQRQNIVANRSCTGDGSTEAE
jgi:hypothetical protein